MILTFRKAALRFQPTKRPQPAQQKVKSKPNFAKIPSSSGADAPLVESKAAPPTAPAFKSTIEDWAGDDDDAVEDYNASVKRDRMSRKKRKKQRHEEKMAAQNWDDIYDPSRPNNYEDYKNSEEKYREIREWKDRLYAHRLKNRRRSDDYSDESEVERPSMSSELFHPILVQTSRDTELDHRKLRAAAILRLCTTHLLRRRSTTPSFRNRICSTASSNTQYSRLRNR